MTCDPCSTFKHALWAPSTQVLLGNSLQASNEHNTNAHYTQLQQQSAQIHRYTSMNK